MPRTHVVITGTGRAGTSFLVELLSHLGLDTGFPTDNLPKYRSSIARAGYETDIRLPNAPYVVKNPWFCDYAEEVLNCDDILIEHVFVPMRNLHEAAESRRHVTAQTVAVMTPWNRLLFKLFPTHINGGVWHKNGQDRQEDLLLAQLYKLFLSLSVTNVPVTLLQFPRMVNDPDYLYFKLSPILGKIPEEQFKSTFARIVRKDIVHQFNPIGRAA